MMRTLCLIVALALAVSVSAQEPVAKPDDPAAKPEDAAAKPEDTAAPAPEAAEMEPAFTLRRIDFGLQGVETDTDSSRFQEYRDVPTGIVIPFARFAGDGKVPYDVTAENVLQNDARYRVRLDPGSIGLEAEFIKIPHRFGNDARSLLQPTEPGVQSISLSLRQAFQNEIARQHAINPSSVNYTFLSSLVNPSLAASRPFDLALLRERGPVEMRLTRDKPLDLRAHVLPGEASRHPRRPARRSGSATSWRARSRSTIGPETSAHRRNGRTSRCLLRGGFHYNDFANAIPFQEFDNPFRATDSTDPNAYQAPGSGSIGGPSFGRVSLAPDNKATTGTVGFLYKFAKRSRLSADATLGQWSQNDAFMPLTTQHRHPDAREPRGPVTLPERTSTARFTRIPFPPA